MILQEGDTILDRFHGMTPPLILHWHNPVIGCVATDYMLVLSATIFLVFPVPLSREWGFDPNVFGRFDLAALVQPYLKFLFVCLPVLQNMDEDSDTQVGLWTKLEGGAEAIFVFGSLFQAKAAAAAPAGGTIQMDMSHNSMLLMTLPG